MRLFPFPNASTKLTAAPAAESSLLPESNGRCPGAGRHVETAVRAKGRERSHLPWVNMHGMVTALTLEAGQHLGEDPGGDTGKGGARGTEHITCE